MNTRPLSVFYHADCLDGFGAALAAWRRFGDRASYRPMQHGQPWSLAEIAGHRVYVLDFSFPPETLEAMAAIACEVVQIDHHLSALKDCAAKFPIGRSGPLDYRHPKLPLRLIFDLDKSGARLAWEFFHPEQALPLMLQHIEEQDLWRFQADATRPFCRALRLQPFAFSTWNRLLEETASSKAPRYESMLDHGKAIECFFQNEVSQLANSDLLRAAQLKGEPVDALQARRHDQAIIVEDDKAWLVSRGLAINANPLFASELGNRLVERSGTWGLVWHMDAAGWIKASLRASGAVDVAEIAARYGGGGHRNAAGFRLAQHRFMGEVLGLTNEQ